MGREPMAIRHVHLVDNPEDRERAEDLLWLRSQGYTPKTLPKHAPWYRPDGKILRGGPTDYYHRTRYRERGLTLKPPTTAPITTYNSSTGQTKRRPRLAMRIFELMQSRQTWEGSASELMHLLDPHAPPGGRGYRVNGMPLTPAQLAKRLLAGPVASALGDYGVAATSGYRGKGRVLRLNRR